MRAIAVDWSGAASGAAAKIWLAEVGDGAMIRLESGRSRDQLASELIREAERDPAMVVGLDFAFSLPEWFVRERGFATARDVWAWSETHAEALLRSPQRPFWGTTGKAVASLTREQEFRRTDLETTSVEGIRPKSVFQLVGAGHVGTGSLRGMVILRRLADAGFRIWPFDRAELPLVIEIYPRVLTGRIVKTSEAAREAFLVGIPELSENQRASAAASDDAFDAAVSAVVMWRRRIELAELPDEPRYRLEGRIWEPRKPWDDLPALPDGPQLASPRSRAAPPPSAGPRARSRTAVEALTSDQASWVAAHARPAVSACLCGRGGATKGRFVPGHDAVLKARLTATLHGSDEQARASAESAPRTFGW